MLGDVLRTHRKSAGMTQEQLAHEAGVHRTYVSLLERNEKSPTLKVLMRLARALNVRPSQLLAKVEEAMNPAEAWWEDPLG